MQQTGQRGFVKGVPLLKKSVSSRKPFKLVKQTKTTDFKLLVIY